MLKKFWNFNHCQFFCHSVAKNSVKSKHDFFFSCVTEAINNAATAWGIRCLRYEIRKYGDETPAEKYSIIEKNLKLNILMV